MHQTVSRTDLEHALSHERFGRYLDWAEGDREAAVALYTLNVQLSEALYVPLQMLEIALRNRIHAVMTDLYHEKWVLDEGRLFGARHREQLAKALADIAEKKKEETPGRIVAELTFSFWTAMIGTDYETLWQTGLHAIAKKPNGKGVARKELSGPLAPIRSLRNRIAHHEPIIMWNLPKHYRNMIEITEWLSPAAAAWCNEHCRFPTIYPSERITLKK